MVGKNEAELNRIRSLEDWRIPRAASLRTALMSLDRALTAVIDSTGWEGEMAAEARKSLSTLQKNFRTIDTFIGQLTDTIENANSYRRRAASAEIPSAQVDPFWANAAKIGSVVVHPVLGPLAADKALDVIGGFLGNQREEEAKRIVQQIERDLAPSADSLRSASATLADFDPRVAMPTPPKPVPPGTNVGAPQIDYPGGGSSPSGSVPGGGGGGGGQQPPNFQTVPGGGGGTGGLNPGGWDPTYPDGWDPTDPDGWDPNDPGGVDGTDPDGSDSGGDDPSVDFPGGGVLPGGPGGTGGGGYPGGSGGSGSLPGGSLPGAFVPGGGGGLGGVVGGGAGAAAIAASSKIASAGAMGGIGGSASGAGVKAGGGLLGNSASGGARGAGTGGIARGGVGGVGGVGGMGGAGGAGSGYAGSAGGGASGAAGGRPGMGMMGAGGADEDDKPKRSGLGGPIAPKLEDEEERGPRAKSAQAGSRDEHTD